MLFDIPWPDLGIADHLSALISHFQPVFDVIAAVVDKYGELIDTALLNVPAPVLILLTALLGAWRVGKRFACFAVVALAAIWQMGLWESTIDTLGLVFSSTILSLVLGVPLGILMARHKTAEWIGRPVLDFMQTMPAFVYLIPAVMCFGLGRVPGIFATVIFAMPPAVRLTALGIKQVPREMIEAGLAFGCTPRQLLFRVQLPTALPAIMAGVNQSIMMALSMIVIASMIGAEGLGQGVLQGINRLDLVLGFQNGLAVVLLAIILDRLTQSAIKTNPLSSSS